MPDFSVSIPRLHEGQQKLEKFSKRFNVVACGRRWGKTTFLVSRACRAALEGKRFGWFCQEYSFLEDAFRQIAARLAPLKKRMDASSAPMVIELITGGIIEFWSMDNPEAGRSRKYHEACVDEAGIAKNLSRMWSENIRATLMDYEGTAWLMGTPKGRNDFYTFFEFGVSESNETKYWGSYTAPSQSNPFISDSEVEDMRNEPGMNARAAAQEIDAEFLADEGELFATWMFTDRFIEPSQVPAIKQWYRGYDTATGDKQYNDDTASVKVAYDEYGNLWLRGFETKKLRPGQLNEWAENLIQADGMSTIHIIEAHNTGYGIAGFMQRQEGTKGRVLLQKIGAKQGGKRQRSAIMASLAEKRKVFIVKEGEYKKFYDQLLDFTGWAENEEDDLIDAVSVVTTFLKETPSKHEKQSIQRSPYAGRTVESILEGL